MNTTVFILNDPPYGTERNFNALRMARALADREGEQVHVFLIGDAVSCAKAGQEVPSGFYNLGTMIRRVARCGGNVGVCGTCLDARGIDDDKLVDGCHRSSTVGELVDWKREADDVLVF